MSDFQEYLKQQLKDPDFQKEWDELEPEINIDLSKPVTESVVFEWEQPFIDIDEEELPFS